MGVCEGKILPNRAICSLIYLIISHFKKAICLRPIRIDESPNSSQEVQVKG